jgi:hypothetical protein
VLVGVREFLGADRACVQPVKVLARGPPGPARGQQAADLSTGGGVERGPHGTGQVGAGGQPVNRDAARAQGG